MASFDVKKQQRLLAPFVYVIVLLLSSGTAAMSIYRLELIETDLDVLQPGRRQSILENESKIARLPEIRV